MVDSVPLTWNDLATIAALVVATLTGIYQIQHYRAQSPKLNILNVTEAKYGQEPARDTDGSRYDLEIKVGNSGRESTTITGGTLSFNETDEILELQRLKRPIIRNSELDTLKSPPKVTDTEVNIPGNDVLHLKYRAHGQPLIDYESKVTGTIQLVSIGGRSCKSEVTFDPRL